MFLQSASAADQPPHLGAEALLNSTAAADFAAMQRAVLDGPIACGVHAEGLLDYERGVLIDPPSSGTLQHEFPSGTAGAPTLRLNGSALTATTGALDVDAAGALPPVQFAVMLTPCKPLDTAAHFGRHRHYQVGYPDTALVEPATVALPPYGTATVHVEYVPSSLSDLESSNISLTNPLLGDWQYQVSGRGELPGHGGTTRVWRWRPDG